MMIKTSQKLATIHMTSAQLAHELGDEAHRIDGLGHGDAVSLNGQTVVIDNGNATGHAHQRDGLGANTIGEGTGAPGFQPLTAELIGDRVTRALSELGLAFCEMEERVRADNGKVYSPDRTLPEGVESTGESVMVNRFAYLETTVVGTVVWKLETLSLDSEDKIAKQRGTIRDMNRQLDSGRVSEAMFDYQVSLLESMVEQQAVVRAAFSAALDTYEVVAGKPYLTKAMREEAARKAAVERPVNQARVDRLARLGITG